MSGTCGAIGNKADFDFLSRDQGRESLNYYPFGYLLMCSVVMMMEANSMTNTLGMNHWFLNNYFICRGVNFKSVGQP